MACTPRSQLYDCERRDSTNIGVFSVTPGAISEVTSTGLADGQTIPILVKDETGEYAPYLIDGEQLVLSENNPSVVIEEEGMYKLDTSAIECPEGGITVTAQSYASEVSSSVTGCYTDAEGNSTPVEIIRYTDGTTPVVYNLGTGERIANPIGEFSQNCCDCEEPLPVQVISDTEQLGCVTDAEGNVTGKVYFVPTLDGDGNMISNRMIMVALDGTVTDPYTGTWESCDTKNCPTAFATECFVLRDAQAQYDNAGGSNPELCGAPSSGPDGLGGGTPSFSCLPEYQITSWIVDGVEVVIDPVPFGPSDKCGPDNPDTGEIGMHDEWSRALNLLDGASGWEAATSPECAWYVRILDQQKSYGTMVIQQVADPSREWVINQAAENISEDMFTRVWQQECDGSVSSFWTDADGVEIDKPEGNLKPCGGGCGSCNSASVDYETAITVEEGCADGVPYSRFRTAVYDEDGQIVSEPIFTYADSAGNVTSVAPANFTLGACPPKPNCSVTEKMFDHVDGVITLDVVKVRATAERIEYMDLVSGTVYHEGTTGYTPTNAGALNQATRTYYSPSSGGDLYEWDIDNLAAGGTQITLSGDTISNNLNNGALDPTTGLIYFGNNTSSRRRVDPTTGFVESLPSLTGVATGDNITAVAITRDGQMYGFTSSGTSSATIYRINKDTGAAVVVGNVAIAPSINGAGVDTDLGEEGFVGVNSSSGNVFWWTEEDGSDAKVVANTTGGNSLDVVNIEFERSDNCFFRCITFDEAGTPTVNDFDVEGQPYTVRGEALLCLPIA